MSKIRRETAGGACGDRCPRARGPGCLWSACGGVGGVHLGNGLAKRRSRWIQGDDGQRGAARQPRFAARGARATHHGIRLRERPASLRPSLLSSMLFTADGLIAALRGAASSGAVAAARPAGLATRATQRGRWPAPRVHSAASHAPSRLRVREKSRPVGARAPAWQQDGAQGGT